MAILYTMKADAGPSESSKSVSQRQLEELEQLADIFASIFGNLSPDQKARYMPEREFQKAA